jgi:hypothetical protein
MIVYSLFDCKWCFSLNLSADILSPKIDLSRPYIAIRRRTSVPIR